MAKFVEIDDKINAFQKGLKEFQINTNKLITKKGRKYKFLAVFVDHFFEASFSVDNVHLMATNETHQLQLLNTLLSDLAKTCNLRLLSLSLTESKFKERVITIKIREDY